MDSDIAGVTGNEDARETEETEDWVEGVPRSVEDDDDDERGSTGVKEGSGERENIVDKLVGVSGMAPSLSTDEMTEAVGLKPEVSYDASKPSGTARDITEGDGFNCVDSYESSVS